MPPILRLLESVIIYFQDRFCLSQRNVSPQYIWYFIIKRYWRLLA